MNISPTVLGILILLGASIVILFAHIFIICPALYLYYGGQIEIVKRFSTETGPARIICHDDKPFPEQRKTAKKVMPFFKLGVSILLFLAVSYVVGSVALLIR